MSECIFARGGNENVVIKGKGGNDLIDGGYGNDTIHAKGRTTLGGGDDNAFFNFNCVSLADNE
jgi:Ca2+-binding RTX toxin-like protein